MSCIDRSGDPQKKSKEEENNAPPQRLAGFETLSPRVPAFAAHGVAWCDETPQILYDFTRVQGEKNFKKKKEEKKKTRVDGTSRYCIVSACPAHQALLFYVHSMRLRSVIFF